MKAGISVNAETNELTITIKEVDWRAVEQDDFYKSEMIVRDLINLVGGQLTADLMRSQEVDVERMELDGKTYYRKEASAGHYRTPYGEQLIERHLYQTSAGGETHVPDGDQLSNGLWIDDAPVGGNSRLQIGQYDRGRSGTRPGQEPRPETL